MLEADTVLQDRYRIISQVGKGGMGTVYVAKDENLGITVAVKQNFFEEPRPASAAETLKMLRAAKQLPVVERQAQKQKQGVASQDCVRLRYSSIILVHYESCLMGNRRCC